MRIITFDEMGQMLEGALKFKVSKIPGHWTFHLHPKVGGGYFTGYCKKVRGEEAYNYGLHGGMRDEETNQFVHVHTWFPGEGEDSLGEHRVDVARGKVMQEMIQGLRTLSYEERQDYTHLFE